MRLAMAATGRRDVVAVREAYHGWTYATDAVSTSMADNPNALATRPDWVHTVESPNSFRGKFRGADASRYAGEAVAADRGADRRRPRARGVHRGAGVRQRGRHGAARPLSGAGVCGGAWRRRPGDRRRGPGRLRPARQLVLGIRAAECGPRHRVGREVDRQRFAARRGDHQPRHRRQVLQSGLFLLVDRREPGVVRDRHHGPRRAPRRGVAAERDTGGRPSEDEIAGAAGRSTRSSARCTASGCIWVWRWFAI